MQKLMPRASIKCLVAFLVLGLALPAGVLALRPPSNYACLAKDADNIAIVRDAGAGPKKLYTDYFGTDYYLLRLEVEKQIFLSPGPERQKVIELVSRRPGGGFVEDAEFKPGLSYLVFLQTNESGPIVLDGSQGALPFVGGKVEVHGRKLSKRQAKVFVDAAHKLDIKCNWHSRE